MNITKGWNFFPDFLLNELQVICILYSIKAPTSKVVPLDSPDFSVFRCVRRSVGPLVTLSLKTRKINIFEQIIVRRGILDSKSHVITSSYNHFIIMRTYRWPYGLCCCKLCCWKQNRIKVDRKNCQNSKIYIMKIKK